MSILGYKLMGNLGGEIVTIDLPGRETRKLFMFQLLAIGLGYKGVYSMIQHLCLYVPQQLISFHIPHWYKHNQLWVEITHLPIAIYIYIYNATYLLPARPNQVKYQVYFRSFICLVRSNKD